MTQAINHKYHTLDAQRGIAALAVVLYHFAPLYSKDYGFQSGYLAVDLFFALSGWVIAHAYMSKLENGQMSSLAFVKARVIRFWPLIALGAALGMLQLLLLPHSSDVGLSTSDSVAAGLLNIAIMPSFFGDGLRMFPANPSEWSLFYELLINVAFVVYITKVGASSVMRRLLLAGMVVSALLIVGMGLHYHAINLGWSKNQIPQGVIRTFFSFTAGIVLYQTRKTWQPKLPVINPAILLLATAVCLWAPFEKGMARGIFDTAFILLLSPMIIALSSVSEIGQKHLSKGIWLGAISYPIYAIHFPVFKVTDTLFNGLPYSSGVAAVVIAILCVVSIWLGKHYDAPIRSKLATLKFKHKKVQTA